MSNSSATGRIKIVRTPAGGAPEEVRKEWVGVILPCAPILGFTDGIELNAVTGEKVPKRYCFHVPQIEAIEALEQKSPDAARWWRELGYPYVDGWFTFGENEAEIVYGVIPQRLVHIPNLDPGVNDRFLTE